ncbi:MAG: efflux transporter outer membrane subunit [Pseudomonadota bacterium]
MPIRCLMSSVCLLALAGCESLPRPFAGEAPPRQLGEDELPFALPGDWQSVAVAGDGKLAEGWAAAFGPEVEALIVEALAQNLDLRASQEAVAQAEAQLAQSRAALFPLLTAGLSGSEAEPLEEASQPGGINFANLGAIDSYSANLSVAWEADLRGVNRAGVRAAQARLEASRAILSASRQNVAALTAAAYYQILGAAQQLELARRTAATSAENAELVSRLVAAGAAARRDEVLAQADLAAAREREAASGLSLRDAARALETLLGRYPTGVFAAPAPLPARTAAFDPETPLDVLRRRPDVIAAEFDVIAGRASADQARARRWPSLSFSSALSSGAADPSDLFDPVSAAVSIGAQLSQTLFDGGFRGAQIDGADAAEREALARYGAAVLAAIDEVETAGDQLTTLGVQAEFLAIAVAASREALALTELRYQAGDTDLLDVLNLRQQTISAEEGLISARLAQVQAEVALYQALGGPVGAP